MTFIDDLTLKSNLRHWLLRPIQTSFLLLIFSPDESEKPFEIQLLFFPEYKERLKKAPLCAGKKQLDEKA